jgi:hypothetical protein
MDFRTLFLYAIAIMLVAGIAYWQFIINPVAPHPADHAGPQAGTYTDAAFGFSFHYPVGTDIVETPAFDLHEFPGASAIKIIQVGKPGDILVYEVTSANSAITDEPNGHASPIAQTKYFYDTNTSTWMVTYPEGREDGGPSASTTASATGQTTGGLPMLPSGRRFDTVIIPLSPMKFVVVTSGGGAGTHDVAASVTPAS